MIEINNDLYVGEGLIRTCYEHPTNKDVCIKIPKPHIIAKVVDKELAYLSKIRKRKKKFDYPFYSDYRGQITTNFGDGQVFDLVRDETTDTVSKTLEYYLQNDIFPNDVLLDKGLDLLKKQLNDYKVFVRDLRARNICCKILNDGAIEMVVIDGMGHRDFIPLADYILPLSKRKNERTFKKFYFDTIAHQREYLENPELHF